MSGSVLIYLGSFLIFGWGIAHLFPTRNVVRGFGEISDDNRRIVTMEWITEGLSLIFTGLLVGFAAYLDGHGLPSRSVYWLAFGFLNALSIVSLFTGYRNSFFAFKLCPFIFSGSSLLIIMGSYLN